MALAAGRLSKILNDFIMWLRFVMVNESVYFLN